VAAAARWLPSRGWRSFWWRCSCCTRSFGWALSRLRGLARLPSREAARSLPCRRPRRRRLPGRSRRMRLLLQSARPHLRARRRRLSRGGFRLRQDRPRRFPRVRRQHLRRQRQPRPLLA
jgi:hypothetical protein